MMPSTTWSGATLEVARGDFEVGLLLLEVRPPVSLSPCCVARATRLFCGAIEKALTAAVLRWASDLSWARGHNPLEILRSSFPNRVADSVKQFDKEFRQKDREELSRLLGLAPSWRATPVPEQPNTEYPWLAPGGVVETPETGLSQHDCLQAWVYAERTIRWATDYLHKLGVVSEQA